MNSKVSVGSKETTIMAEEKIVSEQLTEDQLENVAGGTHEQTYDDMDYLQTQSGEVKIDHNEARDRLTVYLGHYC